MAGVGIYYDNLAGQREAKQTWPDQSMHHQLCVSDAPQPTQHIISKLNKTNLDLAENYNIYR